MEKHKCKICSRRFSNGKAMGGHMRSHLAKLPIPPKIRHQPQELTESTITPSSSSSHAKQRQQQSLSLNNFKSIYSDPSSVHDRESESESSPKNPTRKRSRRTRKFTIDSPAAATEPETASSVCEEEDVAMSLVMLSRDNWGTKGKVDVVAKEDHETETEENSIENEDEDEEDDTLFNARKRTRAIYKCETCKKVFKSYQALGGHRASHKKIRTRIQDDEHTEWSIHGNGGGGNGDYTNQRIFECPFCYKVFASGQALGGHKKVHFSNNAAAAIARTKSSTTSSAKFRDNWIDLNLPAPEEDEDSTVSNAEISFQFK